MNARKVTFEFVVADKDTPVAFDSAEEPFYFVSPFVYLPVVVPGIASVGAGWDDRGVAGREGHLPCFVSLVRSVCYQEQSELLAFGLLLSGSQLLEELPPMRSIMVLAWGNSVEDRGSGVGGDHVELGGQTAPGASDGLGSTRLASAGGVGVDLDRGAVESEDVEVDELFLLQAFEYPLDYSVAGPAAEPHVDGVPVPEFFGKAPPFAALFQHVEDGVEGVEVGDFDAAPLFRERVCYTLVLFLCYSHMVMISHGCNLA